MQLKDFVIEIQEKIKNVSNEEETKMSLVLPFFKLLGYDPFDPTEIKAEFVADHGLKKNEKVDYAIMKDGRPVILVECKSVDSKLDVNNEGQLFRYFGVSDVKFAILTNGVTYKVYSDFSEPNKMDRTPFMEFDLENLRPNDAAKISKLKKNGFCADGLRKEGEALWIVTAMRKILERQLTKPDAEFVKFLFVATGGTRFTEKAEREYSDHAKAAMQRFMSNQVNAMLDSFKTPPELPVETSDTTETELEGYGIVRAILSEAVDPDRIFYDDRKDYFGIWIDSKGNGNQLVKLWFNNPANLRIEVAGQRTGLEKVTDIYKHRSVILATVEGR